MFPPEIKNAHAFPKGTEKKNVKHCALIAVVHMYKQLVYFSCLKYNMFELKHILI